MGDIPLDTSLDMPSYAGPAVSSSGSDISFSDGSFTTAATPTPGLTAGLSNVTGGISSIGSALSNLTSSAQGVFMLVVAGGALWLWLRKKI